MISKARLKELAAYRQQKVCDAESVFVVEGVKMAEEALRSGWHIEAVCATSQWLEQHQTATSLYDSYEVGGAELERLSSMKNPNEVWMLMRRGQCETDAESEVLTLVLDKIQDPGNMGTIMRTADWFGIRHIVCSPETASCYNAKVVQSSMGSIFRTQIDYCDLPQWLERCGRPIYGAVLDGVSIYDMPLERPSVLVIGNESKGIGGEVAALLTHRAAIPNIGGSCESLNAAVATGILCSHFMRKDA